MTGLIWTKEFPEFQSDNSGSPCINFITFRSSPTPVSAAPVASGAQAVALCRQTVCLSVYADCFTMPTSYCAASSERVTVRHMASFSACLVLRTVVMFGSYFALSGLFLPAFSFTASITTEHIYSSCTQLSHESIFDPFQV